MLVHIKIAENDYDRIQRKLFPKEDHREQFGFGLAGLQTNVRIWTLLLRTFIYADESCLECQSGAHVRPKEEFIAYVWTLAKQSKSCIIDFHTHPFSDKDVRFSSIDDAGDRKSYPIAVDCLGPGPHTSVVLGKNSLDARWYDPTTNNLVPVESILILGQRRRKIVPTGAFSHFIQEK